MSRPINLRGKSPWFSLDRLDGPVIWSRHGSLTGNRLPLHRPHRKHRLQHFLNFCMRIRCHGHVFEPLPSDGSLVYRAVPRQQTCISSHVTVKILNKLDVDWIHLAQNNIQWQAVVNTVINHRVLKSRRLLGQQLSASHDRLRFVQSVSDDNFFRSKEFVWWQHSEALGWDWRVVCWRVGLLFSVNRGRERDKGGRSGPIRRGE
jgi:hypothetical protein